MIVKEVLAQKSKDFAPFLFELDGLSFFKHRGKPSVILFGVPHNKQLLDLVFSLRDSLTQIGFPKNEKEFKPHISLGRMKNITRLDQFCEVIQSTREGMRQEVSVSEFVLYESVLKSTGAVYVVLQKFPLG